MSDTSKSELHALIVSAVISELPQAQFDQRRIDRQALLLKLLSQPSELSRWMLSRESSELD